MPQFRRWADLPPDLLCRIGDRLHSLQWYASARGACTGWRRALAPPSPSLLLVGPDLAKRCSLSVFLHCTNYHPSAASLPARRSFHLNLIRPGRSCVGSSNGWLALALAGRPGVFSLFNPITAAEILLPPLLYGTGCVSKIVFAPRPAADDFVAAAICMNRLVYVTAGARRWAVLDPVRLASGDQLADLLHHEDGTVYCVTRYGDVHVLRLPERRRRKPIVAATDDPNPATPLFIRQPTRVPSYPAAQMSLRIQQQRRVPAPSIVEPAEPHLNAPATVEPLLAEDNLPFDPATSFSPPYDKVAIFTGAKSMVFCEGNLYQIWRNASCAVTLQLPGGRSRRVEENEIFVLRYYPRRQPCWDVVTDLGGYSVFVGRNNTASMYAEGILGLNGDCVYWLGGSDGDEGMVFDMETRRSTPCLPAVGRSAICWYFLSDMVNKCNNSNGGNNLSEPDKS
ncbi:uncharacterized protein LOC124662282 [Lolium rigidum]|uniref:uncharacterized protein LOC124662282 n=1 Tax=Lolium rigidum TaxID=89674 RepID=UPI001F5C4C53|nr:uncharacterized protein LOC124662282 [Lolium rigidum]